MVRTACMLLATFRETNIDGFLILLLLSHILGQSETAILSRKKDITASIHTISKDFNPQLAIDGNPRRDAAACECCASTQYKYTNWYQLNLGRFYTVHRIHVEGRSDVPELNQHFQGMRIYLKSIHNDASTGAVTNIADATYDVDYVLPVPLSTQFVSLALYDQKRVFTVCELTVYGDCADGEFGDYCESVCHCDGGPCDKTTGVCPSGRCLPGYQGEACDKVCDDDTYGYGCTERCGNCSGTDICDNQDGKCPGQCAVGYQGDQCKNECNRGTYGLGCSQSCGNCQGGDICMFTDGTCPNGCKAGYLGDTCNTECIDGTYGEGCTMQCGSCANGKPCNKTNGACLACAPGYFGIECKPTENSENQPKNESLAVTISGWIFGGVTLMVALGVIIALGIRMRRIKRKPPTTDARLYDIPRHSRSKQDHAYDSPISNP